MKRKIFLLITILLLFHSKIVYAEEKPLIYISLDKTYVRLNVGEEEELTVFYNPEDTTDNKEVTWISMNDQIVTVKDGKIKARAIGSSSVVAMVGDSRTTCVIDVVPTLYFLDVKQTDWFYESVKYVFENNIILGYNTTTFAPNDKVTRAQLVTILWRMEDTPDAYGIQNKFEDVPKIDYYTDAVKWAESKGIIHGYNDKLFGPNDPITRQDLAVILNNYAKYIGLDSNDGEDISTFADYKEVKGSYSELALKWAVKNKVMSGQNIDGKKYISPTNNATRAETAAMISNFIQKFNLKNEY